MEQDGQLHAQDLRNHPQEHRVVWGIRNMQYGLSHCTYHLFSILKMYNYKSGTFFTLINELGFALHEMFEVSPNPWESFHMKNNSNYGGAKAIEGSGSSI